MEINLSNIDFKANRDELKEALAEQLLHNKEFFDTNKRRINFKIYLDMQENMPTRNVGTARLVLPDARIVAMVMKLVKPEGKRKQVTVKVNNRKIFFQKSGRTPTSCDTEIVSKVPYQDPSIDRERNKKLLQLRDALRLNTVQFGVWEKRPTGVDRRGVFCWEYSKAYTSMQTDPTHIDHGHKLALLNLDYVRKNIRIQLGHPSFDQIAHSILIKFPSIRNIWIGHEIGSPFVCFDLITPPILESEYFNRTETGIVRQDSEKFRQRVGSLNATHASTSPYAHHMRVVLYQSQDLEEFRRSCSIAGLRTPALADIESLGANYFSQKKLTKVQTLLRKKEIPWTVAFQVEILLHNGLLTTDVVTEKLWSHIEGLCRDHPTLAANILRTFVQTLTVTLSIDPQQALNELRKISMQFTTDKIAPLPVPPNLINCHHVTFTPTRMTLEGPYPVQSNRVIRRYAGFHDYFIRVDFRDEDRLQYRWDREVDGKLFLQDRVGGILKNGFTLAGRSFEFLGYSSSALREHAVWFVSPFDHPREGRISAASIRKSLGDFSRVLLCPARYAARLAQAFTATDPGVRLTRDQWSMIPDIGDPDCPFTDGNGTISRQLAEKITTALGLDNCPSAFQIRFLGYKGMVSVDDELEGEQMCLRPSMEKFSVNEVQEADLEIAQAFHKPGQMALNRPLITIMEARGVNIKAFETLQHLAVADTATAHQSVEKLTSLMRHHNLCCAFQLSHILRKLTGFGLELSLDRPTKSLRNAFMDRIIYCTTSSILRDIKYRANIPVPESWRLVGVADEGPAYEARGYDNVFSLEDGEIFACIQTDEDSEPFYLQDQVDISRSPAVHPGDIQRVHAIGKPPDNKLCLFRNLKNCVVFSCKGTRPLPNCLGGGDLDGDLYDLCTYGTMLTFYTAFPAKYPKVAKHMIEEKELRNPNTGKIEEERVIPHVCDFVVEYIYSDVLGLLSDNHLIRADQSSLGILDSGCEALAKLCSQAVDYPKNGMPVDIQNIPRRLIPYKPDWKEREEDGPGATDIYRSEKALGVLYRAIELLKPTSLADSHAKSPPLSENSIFLALQPIVNSKLDSKAKGKGKKPAAKEDTASDRVTLIERQLRKYTNELRYICCTHTLSDRHDVQLSEEEVVVGTILAQCSQNRWRKERIYRMREHTSKLYRDTLAELLPSKGRECTLQEVRAELSFAWSAWQFTVEKSSSMQTPTSQLFGLNSFGLIALQAILDCFERIDTLEKM